MENSLSIRGLSKKYSKSEDYALNEIDLELTPGIYGLLGANGAGKTTLFNILTGIIEKSNGQISFKGEDVFKDIEEFKCKIGYMPQQQDLYPDMTVAKFLTYMAVLKGVLRFGIKEEVSRVLEATDIREIKDRPIATLSGGMKQRVLISQALLNDPEILILDEPTAGLDPKQRVIIRNLISKISRDKIILISTHVVSDIEHISKEIIILKAGRVVLKDSLQRVLDKYKDIVYEITCDDFEFEQISASYKISKMQVRADSSIYVKIYGDFEETPIVGDRLFNKAIVDLEDIYLYIFSGEK